MEVEQQPFTTDAATMDARVSPGTAVDDVSVSAGSTTVTMAGKVAGEVDDEAEAIQPAAPTMPEVAQIPSPLPAPISLSPVKFVTLDESENGGIQHSTAIEDNASNGCYSKDSNWVDDNDAESGSSQPDDSRVAHFDFGVDDGVGDLEQFGEEVVKTITLPVIAGMGFESQTQQISGNREVDDLVSLPSPVAAPTSSPRFDVFSTSPAKRANGKIMHEQAPLSTSELRDLPDEAILAPLMSAMTVQASDVEEVLTQTSTAGCAEAQEQTPSSTTEDPVMHPPSDMLAELSISSADPKLKASSLKGHDPTQEMLAVQQSSATQLLSQSQTVPQLVDAIKSSSGYTEASTAHKKPVEAVRVSSPAARELMFGMESSADHHAALEAPNNSSSAGSLSSSGQSQPPFLLPSESSTSASVIPVEDERVTDPQAASRPEVVFADPGAKSRSPKTETPKPKASPPKTSKATKPSVEVKAISSTKHSKPKDSRITTRPPATKAKSDGVKAKVPVPVKTALVKAKSKADDAKISATSTVKAAPSKPNIQRSGVSSQASERAARAPSKSLTVPTGPSKQKSVSGSTKEKVSSVAPPPAPSAIESQGIPSIKKRLSSSELEAASNRLYANAVESKKRKEALKAELEESFTFAPQVNSAKRRSTLDDKNRFGLQHEKAQEAIKKREEIRQKREKSECTFKPKITAKARKLSAKSPNPRYENLYKNAQEIRQKRDDKKNENDQKAVEECSFKPKIKNMKSPTKSRPLYDAERMKQKKLALEQKKIEVELSKCTFKPKVVAKSTKTKGDEARDKAAGEAKLFDRLYQASQKRAENLEKLRHEREEQEKSIATFQPKITSSHAAKGGVKQPFHKRLYNKDYMQKVTADREQKKLDEERKFTHKPQISAVPDEIKSKQSSAPSSPDKSIFERLYDEKDKVKEKIELSEEIKMQKEMAGCTFHPHIETSPNHQKNQPAVPIWERLLSYDKNQVIEEREKQRQQLEMQECTFKPEVKPSDYFTPKKSPSAGIFDRLAGGAVSMPSSEMKRRESEKRGVVVGQPKRRSVPELGAIKELMQAASVGNIIKSSKIVLSPETSPDSSANQPRSLPSSPQGAILKLLAKSNGDMNGASVSPKSKQFADGMTDNERLLIEERSSPEDASNLANNTDEPSETQSQSILENYDSWASNLEVKMRSLS